MHSRDAGISFLSCIHNRAHTSLISCLFSVTGCGCDLGRVCDAFVFVRQETGLYEYKVFGSLASCAPDVCADVYMDLNYRRQWDSYVKGNYEWDLSQPNIFIKTWLDYLQTVVRHITHFRSNNQLF